MSFVVKKRHPNPKRIDLLGSAFCPCKTCCEVRDALFHAHWEKHKDLIKVFDHKANMVEDNDAIIDFKNTIEDEDEKISEERQQLLEIVKLVKDENIKFLLDKLIVSMERDEKMKELVNRIYGWTFGSVKKIHLGNTAKELWHIFHGIDIPISKLEDEEYQDGEFLPDTPKDISSSIKVSEASVDYVTSLLESAKKT